tara:strand:+ start:1422 stop:1553 length:132 start_codon:yes stop_codon:yes gene_type:complete
MMTSINTEKRARMTEKRAIEKYILSANFERQKCLKLMMTHLES